MPSFSTVSTGRYSDDTQQARAIVEVYRERVFMDAQLFAEKAARYGPWGDAIADEDVCGIPGTAGPIALFAIRCWLRSPHAWLPRVLDAISAGGDTDTAAAVTGGLLGASLGASAIPPRFAIRIRDVGHGGVGELTRLCVDAWKQHRQ